MECDWMPTVTAKDIAEKIQRPGEELQVAVDRLRNWTREGLIKPVGAKHPGKGRAKQYPRKVIFEAALLQLLIDCTGIGAVAAGPLLDAAKVRLTPLLKKNEIDLGVLLIGRSMGRSEFFMAADKFENLRQMLAQSGDHDSYTIVKLRKLLDHLYLEKD
jgi:hypothetical protein